VRPGGTLRGFDSRRLHFFGHCANRGRDEPVGGQDLGAAVDAQLVDQEAQERLGLLRVGFGQDLFKQVGGGGEIGGRGRLCALHGRSDGEFGLLGVEVVETRLEVFESGVASFGRGLALFEGLVVAL